MPIFSILIVAMSLATVDDVDDDGDLEKIMLIVTMILMSRITVGLPRTRSHFQWNLEKPIIGSIIIIDFKSVYSSWVSDGQSRILRYERSQKFTRFASNGKDITECALQQIRIRNNRPHAATASAARRPEVHSTVKMSHYPYTLRISKAIIGFI